MTNVTHIDGFEEDPPEGPVSAAFVVDLPFLGGSAKLQNKGVKVHTLVHFDSE